MLLDFAFAAGGCLNRGSGLLLANRLGHESWACRPEADATILSATVCPSDHDSSPHVACVIYAYQVKSHDYSGLCAKSFLTRREALKFVAGCWAQTLIARYRPECPEESCLFIDSDDLGETVATRILSTVSAQA
jgi:hypothetical protein